MPEFDRTQTAAMRAAITEPQSFEAANRLFFRLYQCANLIHKNGTRAVAALETTTQQWAVLGALARPGTVDAGMTVKGMTSFLMVSRQNITGVLDRLEQRGLIERVRGADDGRERLVRMTPEGQAHWQALRAPIEAFYGSALQNLDDSEQRMLIALLDKVRAGLARDEDAGRGSKPGNDGSVG